MANIPIEQVKIFSVIVDGHLNRQMWGVRINDIAPSAMMPMLFNVGSARLDTYEAGNSNAIWCLCLFCNPQGGPEWILQFKDTPKFISRCCENNDGYADKQCNSASLHIFTIHLSLIPRQGRLTSPPAARPGSLFSFPISPASAQSRPGNSPGWNYYHSIPGDNPRPCRIS
jgi:hypothetical protein